MPIEVLLDNTNSTLTTMSLQRVFLSPDEPDVVFACDGYELLIYPLIGDVHISCPEDGEYHLRGRKSVTQKPRSALRVYNNSSLEHSVLFSLGRASRHADILVACLDVGQKPEDEDALISYMPVEEITSHTVGKGTHRRQVRVIEKTEPPYQLWAGETLNVPGGWSSYPAHANAREADTKFAEWQEMFFVITTGYGVMKLNGWYTNGGKAEGVRLINNGDSFATPLGSHPIVFAPDALGWYFWCYSGTAIEKKYNSKATDVSTYVK